MIRAERRFASDVGGCRACDKFMHPLETDEVVCIRVGSLHQSQELRFCDDCLPHLLAEAVIAQKAKATHTKHGSFLGVDFAPKGDESRTPIARTTASVRTVPKRKRPKAKVSPIVPRSYRAKRPAAEPPKRGRAECPECGSHYALNRNGRIRTHSVLISIEQPKRRCPGSGRNPREATHVA